MKDLILRDPEKTFSVRDFLRNPYFTYEYKGTADLLMEMKEYAVNLAIVLDEYGATAGMITLAFALLVNGMMYYRLKKIDMIESLKSVE